MATYSWNFTTSATCALLLVDTPTLHTDWLIATPHRPWLVTCSLSAILLSSSRLISSSLRWGPFSCCLTISRSFLCCWERGATGKEKWTERLWLHREISLLKRQFSPTKSWREILRWAEARGREQKLWVIFHKQMHTYCLPLISDNFSLLTGCSLLWVTETMWSVFYAEMRTLELTQNSHPFSCYHDFIVRQRSKRDRARSGGR